MGKIGIRTEYLKSKYINKCFGNLLILEIAGCELIKEPKSKERTRPLVKIICNCGNEKIMKLHSITCGTTSCGCKKGKQNSDFTMQERKTYEFSALNHKYNSYKTNAIKKGILFELSKMKFKEIAQKDCTYCGVKNSNEYKVFMKSTKTFSVFIHNGVDRIDSSLGYVEGNCAPCCKHCNWAKHTLSIGDFKELISKIYFNFINTHHGN